MKIIFSCGLGLDSTAILLRRLTEPGSCWFDLRDLVVVTAQTGDEWVETAYLVEQHIYPLLAHHGVRTIQVARAGRRQADGIVILDDTIHPILCLSSAPGAYRLSEELLSVATVPQSGGIRKCSLKFKGWVLDQVIAQIVGDEEFVHVVGFEAGEARRMLRDMPLGPGTRIPSYPLIEWGWYRADCERYVLDQLGVKWPKSACVQCLIWNLGDLRLLVMTLIIWDKFPLVAGHEHARRWLQFTANIGRASNTVVAYGRAVEDHLRFCALVGADPLTVRADVVAAWIGALHERPNPRASNLAHFDSGVGLANATIQQYVVAARSFYQFLVEDELRERNPVRRGESGRRGRRPRQGLVRRVEKAPWIPNEWDWERILRAAQAEPLRNRLMVSLAYDAALRREELVQLEVGDFEPAYSLIHLRAETTKSKRAREVSFGAATSRLFMAYLAERRELVGRSGGRLLISVSRRNHGSSLGPSSWSKIVTRIADRADVSRLSPHTFRHLRLTDLARAEWTIDQIAQYAGHRDLSTTLRYIHLSGRELAEKLRKSSASIQASRERLLATLGEAP
ncbi:tyrosine-type recombinase/integrase [Nonomuraea sp. GTA35]|uniref:tyrosine-type recombinase/integrase n=1 Tax=Nonomuraea sp. GTA35 TaxID=1676746 RepID=UPI0035BF83D7